MDKTAFATLLITRPLAVAYPDTPVTLSVTVASCHHVRPIKKFIRFFFFIEN